MPGDEVLLPVLRSTHLCRGMLTIFWLATSAPMLCAQERIISLAPHTTELVYALGVGDKLVAVSDYSNFPEEASLLPSVANHNGVDFEQIMRLQPDLILAWRGGNKPQDLARLRSLGYKLYYSNPIIPADISSELRQLGALLGKSERGIEMADAFSSEMENIKIQYRSENKIAVFYYMWPSPLMTIGGKAWANQLLDICGARNIFDDAPTPYPEVNMEQVIRRKPHKIIAAMHTSLADADTFWRTKVGTMPIQLVVVDPDQLHRFTPRLTSGLKNLCQQLHE
ncbi:MAG: vitamin B12 transport system substrate-binding protein [Paraglaciecola sp.]|jgi:vitamin B12 transport system substrate-binding protein